MYRSQLIRSTKSVAQYSRVIARNNSTSAVSKATNAVSSVTSTVSNIISKTVFWAKVVGELGKQVYIKEGMAPPTSAQLKSVAELLQSQAKTAFTQPEKIVNTLKEKPLEYSVKFGIAAVQVFGLFSLGEIIGRRHVIGYKKH